MNTKNPKFPIYLLFHALVEVCTLRAIFLYEFVSNNIFGYIHSQLGPVKPDLRPQTPSNQLLEKLP